MAEAFIVRRGGVGSSGGTLVVTSSGAGTVTVSNSALGKSYSKSVTAGGSVTFKGLKTGEWTVTLSNGAQTATRSIIITSDYSTSLAYFSAYINITYPANSNCVVTNSGGQIVASDTNAGSSTKTWTAVLGTTGTYTVTATATDGSGRSKSQSVSITFDGQVESVTLSYWDGTLFDNGNQYSEITGGWTGVSGNNLVSDHGNAWVSNNPISVAQFTAIHFNVVGYVFYGEGANGWLGLYNTKNPPDNPNSVAHLVIGSTGTYTIDVSSLTGSYYVRGNVSKWDQYWGTQTVNKIWLT